MFEKNLKYYRLKKGLSKKELAEAVGVSPMAVTNYEKGTRRPDMDIIGKLANALDVRVSDFIALRNNTLRFEHNEFRRAISLSETQQEYIKESVEEYFSRFFNAVDCLGGEPLPLPIKCHTLTKTGDAEKDASKLRAALGFPIDGPVKEIITTLDNKGVLVLDLDISDDRFSGINGMVNDYPYIALNRESSPERKRSTLVHELVHMMFSDIGESKEDEKYATEVSGAFLIGRKDLIRELGLERKSVTNDMLLVCKEYGISMWLLIVRAAKNGIISSMVAQDFYVRASKAGWRKNEPSRIANEESTLFRQLVYRAINEDSISIQKGAELLHMTYKAVLDECSLIEV